MSNPTTSSQEFTTVPIGNEDTVASANNNNNNGNNNDNDNNNNNNMSSKEKAPNRMMRTTKNAWRKAVGCCKKSTPRTKIRLREHEIAKRKNAFGMQYIDLVCTHATEEQLQQAVQACLQDIEGLMQEIIDLENKIEQVSEETKSKIKTQPTGSSSTNNNKALYANSGLYSGGDPSIEETEDEDDVNHHHHNNNNNNNKSPPPQGAFSITENDDDDNADLNKDSWLPPPPSSLPPAVPVEDKPSASAY
ncbi:unnamed protein product [Cylindrotheca closterium]|uniref:Uncharacterized protein n=1 Tax=Cylindrotheca closterium TaxID=2856 RepID=A0AAD2FQX5_9STRA|nr:unnamed protein product [Cylindrotheca closterium]